MTKKKTISPDHELELEGRALDPALVASLGCYSVQRHGTEFFAIPFIRHGKVVNHKYRTVMGPKRFEQDANAVKCFWNEDVLRDPMLATEPLIITEGEFDAFAAIQSGFARTMSVPDGAPSKEIGGAEDAAKYSYLADAKPLILPQQIIILATDGDEAGTNLMRDLSLRLGRPRCKFVQYPLAKDGSRRLKDLNEVLEWYGARGVRECIERAQWVAKPGVYAMSQRPVRPERRKVSLHMGEAIDKIAKIRRGDFWVFSGPPGHGKSALVDDIACRVALHEGLRTCFASFEKEPETDHRRDLRKWFIGNARGHSGDEKWTAQEIRDADEFIERSFRFVVPSDEDDASLEWLCEQFEAAAIQQSCDVLIVDPWNEVEHVRPPDMSLTEYTGYAIKRLKRLARYLDVTVFVVAHPAKMKADEEITLWSISDSAHWANKCDVGVIMRRKVEEGNVTSTAVATFQKVRNDDIGRAGKTTAAFDTITRHFQFFAY